MSGPIVVASGGRSLEREVSLRSGRHAGHALEEMGYEVVHIDPDHSLVSRLREIQPSLVFIAMHGRGGEDGTLQDLLEILGIPYTGSNVHASARCFDKQLFKKLLTDAGLDTPAWHSFNREAFAEFGAGQTLVELTGQLGLPLVVKPVGQGSSLGIKFVHAPDDFNPAILSALSYDDRVLIERYVAGRELAVTVLGPSSAPEVLPVVEIATAEPYYNFTAHYESGVAELKTGTLSDAVRERVEEAARRAYVAADCRDFARVDIILDADDRPQILEINTIPGLTETGPARFAAETAGKSFTDLIAAIIARTAGAA